MAITRQGIADAVRSLLGISAYIPTEPLVPEPPNAEALRILAGGQIQPILSTKTRWYMADLERAALIADGGNLSQIGKLCRSMRRDGLISGLMGTRTSGLVALPKRFTGDEEIIADLTADTDTRSIFDEMLPPAELALLAADGIGVGAGIGELVPVKGREHPVLVRLEPEFLQYRNNEGRWYYQSIAGTLPITPGDGRWVLHTPGGALNPWTYGEWHALGRAFITKEHAFLHRANYSAKLANPARVGVAPPNASEDQRISFIAKLLQWGLNTAFAMPVGWDVKLLESNGRGWEVFDKEIDSSNLEVMITLAGQVVTVTGGTGFANADIHKTIRADLITQTGLALAHTINTQAIPPYVFKKYGKDRLARSPRVAWQTDPPEDLKASADAADAFGRGVKSANEALKPYGKQLDVEVMATRHSLPLTVITKPKDLQLPEAEAAKVVRVDEARESLGLDPIGDERMLQELTDAAKTEAAEVQADAKTDVAKMKPAEPAGPPNPKAHRSQKMRAISRLRAGGDFKEEDHPRSDDGKFGSGGGGSDDSSNNDDEPEDDDDDDDDDDDSGRPSDEHVHEAVTERVEARNKQVEHVQAARADVKQAEKFGNIASNQRRKADRLDLPSNKHEIDVGQALEESGVMATEKDMLTDELTDLYNADQRVQLLTGTQALEDGWRRIHIESLSWEDAKKYDHDDAKMIEAHKDVSVDDIKRQLFDDRDAKQIDELIIGMNQTRNAQAKFINGSLDKIDAAAELHDTDPHEDDDNGINDALAEHGFETWDRDQLSDAVLAGDSFKPIKDLDKAKKKVNKSLDDTYG